MFDPRVAPPRGNVGASTFAIDPVLLFQNGQQYMVWRGHIIDGNNRLYVARMSSPWDIAGGARYIAATGECSNVHEAPSILQHGGRTFVVYSNRETRLPSYQLRMLSIASTDDPMTASWHEYPTAVFARNDAAGVFGPGSNGFFTSPDGTEDWIGYHAKVTAGTNDYNRSTRAQRLRWNGDGTPDFGSPLSLTTDIDLPSGDPGSP